ncbi:MAG: iron chelate uptake ABC transporter family permease subunit [Spirochaetaceae bacterium]|nr:iron chelate uptake ABC transporter family permease subunit [Spirochaetaceae bacterium]
MTKQTQINESARISTAFRTKKEWRNFLLLFLSMSVIALLCTIGLLVYKNPVPMTSPSFFPIVRRRIVAVIAMILAALCQSTATLTFQSITNNRVITPSLLGFDALYAACNTAVVFFFGTKTLIALDGLPAFCVQVILMVFLAAMLYGTLLRDSGRDMQFVLLIGIVIGTGLRSVASFMRRVLEPSEFDVLQAKLFGSVNNADPSYFYAAIPLVVISIIMLYAYAPKLNVLSLGKDVSTVLGLHHRFHLLVLLSLVSVLMAVSTALVGSLTFYGFLVVTLVYRLVPTYDHRYLYPMAIVLAFLIITAAYFCMYHIFHAQGVVTIIIELFGGVVFLAMILKKSAY